MKGATASVAAAQQAPPHLNSRFPAKLPAVVNEAVRLLDLQAAIRPLRAGHELVSEGRRCASVSLITDGAAIRYRILRDGQRQILNVLLPGDFAGLISCRFENAPYSIKTLTPASVATIPLPRLVGLLDSHPRLAARLFWRSACEATMLAERLIAVGRRPARERVAHFLMELLVRLQTVGLADERSYRLPLTQEMVADMLGLSIPYLNRILRDLRDDGLVRVKGQMLVIDDLDELAAVADFEHGYLRPLSVADLLPGAPAARPALSAGKDSETFFG
ncbi:MAG TPA: Crp/Fnr family transcriptional regulator [Stellaceae bacterium]|nr:Crp/Fnr family transcriptional regulator [Stellaceae bacterium]